MKAPLLITAIIGGLFVAYKRIAGGGSAPSLPSVRLPDFDFGSIGGTFAANYSLTDALVDAKFNGFGNAPAAPAPAASSAPVGVSVGVSVADKNVRAFLDTIAKCEGTYGRGDNGYNILFGGGIFSGYADHPRIYFRSHDTTAAGRYQITKTTWDALVRIHGKKVFPDFSPASQDRAAIELIKGRRALDAVRAGDWKRVAYLCREEWASLPDSQSGQPKRTHEYVRTAFVQAGGVATV